MDKASPHYSSRKVTDYIEQNKDTIIPVYLPTATPEFMILEEVWISQARFTCTEILYSSFADFKRKRYLAILEQKDSILTW